VVVAAGVWSPELVRTAGFDLPVEPVLREVVTTSPADGLPDSIPLTVDFTTGFYFHREGQGLLIGMADREQAPGFDAPTDPAWLERVVEVASRRAPAFLELGLAHGWKGYYEVTPDHNGLVGEAASPERLFYATGFSGHGFMQAPAVGEIVRDLVLGHEPFVDVTPLAVERFGAGAPRPEHNVI
jgi:sarcosine oxidase subunit beta